MFVVVVVCLVFVFVVVVVVVVFVVVVEPYKPNFSHRACIKSAICV